MKSEFNILINLIHFLKGLKLINMLNYVNRIPLFNIADIQVPVLVTSSDRTFSQNVFHVLQAFLIFYILFATILNRDFNNWLNK